MKAQSVCLVCLLVLFVSVFFLRKEGFKNVAAVARVMEKKVKNRSLPSNAICATNAQCQSNLCLANAALTLYGYCK